MRTICIGFALLMVVLVLLNEMGHTRKQESDKPYLPAQSQQP